MSSLRLGTRTHIVKALNSCYHSVQTCMKACFPSPPSSPCLPVSLSPYNPSLTPSLSPPSPLSLDITCPASLESLSFYTPLFLPLDKKIVLNPLPSYLGLYKNSTVQDERLLKIIWVLGFPISQRFTSLGSLNMPDMEYWISRCGSASVFFQHVCSVNAVLLDLQGCYSGSGKMAPVDLHRNKETGWKNGQNSGKWANGTE